MIEKRYKFLKALEEGQSLKPKAETKHSEYHDHFINDVNTAATVSNANHNDGYDDDNYDDDDGETVVGSDSEESYHSTVDAMQRQQEGESGNNAESMRLDMPSTSKTVAKIEKRPMSLLLALKEDKYIVASDNKVIDQGVKVKGSDIEKVIAYLSDRHWKGKAPNGTSAVIQYIKESDLHVRHLIKNPDAIDRLKNTNLSWLSASKFSQENITRRKT